MDQVTTAGGRPAMLLSAVIALLPPALRRHATPMRQRLWLQFLQFGTVGLVGLAIDTAVVYGLRGPLGLYGAGLASYGVAATTTWWLNRHWTFRGHGGSGRAHRQWALFLLANAAGFVLNRGTYAALVTWAPLCAAQPVLATSAGAVAGMFINFSLSRSVVFRPPRAA